MSRRNSGYFILNKIINEFLSHINVCTIHSAVYGIVHNYNWLWWLAIRNHTKKREHFNAFRGFLQCVNCSIGIYAKACIRMRWTMKCAIRHSDFLALFDYCGFSTLQLRYLNICFPNNNTNLKWIYLSFTWTRSDTRHAKAFYTNVGFIHKPIMDDATEIYSQTLLFFKTMLVPKLVCIKFMM